MKNRLKSTRKSTGPESCNCLIRQWRTTTKQKLVEFLQDKVGGSGKGIRRILEANGCRVNGRIERFGSTWIDAGDLVEFFPNEKTTGHFERIFENEDFTIVNKPAGWACTPENAQRQFGVARTLVHRLDKDTTGVLLLAKTSFGKEALFTLFSQKQVDKEYWALVDGVLREEKGVRESFLAKKRSFHGQTIWGSSGRGDFAVTSWKKVATGDRATLVCCQPMTGRTHQIRVHMAEMGHPILGDRQYADQFRSPFFAPRPLLHARRICFSFREQVIEAFAPLPPDFCQALTATQVTVS